MRFLLDQLYGYLLVNSPDFFLPLQVLRIQRFANERMLVIVPLLVTAEHEVMAYDVVGVWPPCKHIISSAFPQILRALRSLQVTLYCS